MHILRGMEDTAITRDSGNGPRTHRGTRRSRSQRRSRGPTAGSVALGEGVAQRAGECFGLAGVGGVAAYKPAMVAGKDRRLLTRSFGRGHRRASGEGPDGLFSHDDHDACRRPASASKSGAIAGGVRGSVRE